MLEVGNGKLTVDENIAHFTLWCMMAAPLILGNDVRKLIKADGKPDLSSKILQIVTNKDLIAVNQDTLGIQCVRYKRGIYGDILVKPLENGEIALCFFNKSNLTKQFEASLSDIANETYSSLPVSGSYSLFDLWSKEESKSDGSVKCTLRPHSVAVYRIKAD